MNIESFVNVFTLVAAVIGLLISLFKYIEYPKRGWLYMSVFFLADILSDYYWTTYMLVMHDSPDVSEIMAYFGWNIAFLILFIAMLSLRPEGAKKYFNPLILLPIPLSIWQFTIYIQYGGLFNNLWQCGFTAAIAVLCMQVILYYFKNRKKGAHFPHLHVVILLYIISQYVSWTSTCFDWNSDLQNPYYYASITGYILMLFFSHAVSQFYKGEGYTTPEKDAAEIKTHIALQIIVSMIIISCCAGGFYLAIWMKRSLPEDESAYGIIAVVLFLISVFLAFLILAVIYLTASRYKSREEEHKKRSYVKRNRFNLIFTILVTLILMVFAVVYNSTIYYRASVSNIYDSGEEKTATTTTALENYLTKAISTLKVTADSIELMINNGESNGKVLRYILQQTQMQKSELDENFTGLYAYIDGEYMDGLGWTPPEDYNAVERAWYHVAVEAGGKTVIVSPYVDAQTNSVVITITKMLSSTGSDGYPNVVSLDVIVNYIQETIESVSLGNKGYAMIVNDDGFIVSHKDRDFFGKDFNDIYGSELLDSIKKTGSGRLDAVVDDNESTLFISPVMDQWHVVVVVSNPELFENVYSQLTFNILVSLVIFALITFFYYIGYMNEQASSRKMEEMSANKQKQEYEAEVLRLEKRSADEANKAKSKFLADMSHEIRTPINAILGMNEMVLREAEDKNLQEYARNIEVSGKNLLQLINSILDFSKIEDGKMEIIPVTYSVSSLITYLINSIQERSDSKGLDFNVEIDPEIPSELYGDDTRINQIILNLLTNAVKYTQEGSVTLSMKLQEKKDNKALIYVEVKDTGIGIRESDMQRLFESFERLDEIRNRNIEGTGLGISITTNLLKLMDSELKVESTYGKGSVFSFELWQKIMVDEPLGDYSAPTVEVKESYHESFHAPSAYILIVDDTKMNLTVAVNLLKKTGIRIDTATSGDEAISLCDKNTYDLILMDQRMPKMNGTQALERIRELESGKNKDNPVICLTADAIRGARERYIAEGFTDYLTKPIDGRSLERALSTYLPKEKIIVISASDDTSAGNAASADKATAADTTSGDGNALFAALRKAGVDTASGISFCGNSEESYISILSDYASEHETRSKSIKEYYEKKEWNDYSIYVHSLKSTSKTIGAKALSEAAAALEAAASEENEEAVNKDHERALKMYDEIAAAIRSNIDAPDDDDDSDILEFAPVDKN
ncbi:MAG: response regulator [Lachnospiraceae bacterium]|nr:response regulator [Lachnospiraceae bacterium]